MRAVVLLGCAEASTPQCTPWPGAWRHPECSRSQPEQPHDAQELLVALARAEGDPVLQGGGALVWHSAERRARGPAWPAWPMGALPCRHSWLGRSSSGAACAPPMHLHVDPQLQGVGAQAGAQRRSVQPSGDAWRAAPTCEPAGQPAPTPAPPPHLGPIHVLRQVELLAAHKADEGGVAEAILQGGGAVQLALHLAAAGGGGEGGGEQQSHHAGQECFAACTVLQRTTADIPPQPLSSPCLTSSRQSPAISKGTATSICRRQAGQVQGAGGQHVALAACIRRWTTGAPLPCPRRAWM